MENLTEKLIIKDMFGANLTVEDAVILRNLLLKNIQLKKLIILDFKDVKVCPNYFNVLLINLLAINNRKEIYNKLLFENLNDNENFKRVYYGTSITD